MTADVRDDRRSGSVPIATAAVFLSTLGYLLTAAGLAAQTPVGEEGEEGLPGLEIDGPPAPTPPEVMTRDPDGGATVRAVRVTESLRIDGVLDEAFYQNPPIPSFLQTVPINEGESTERTEAWIGFDDRNVYVAARVWDSAPESDWVANEMRRDASALRTNDNFGVFLDTFYDRRNAVAIYVNPLGGFSDLQMTNEGNPNFDWNPVVEVRSGRFDGGWTVEIAIPFRSLRYRAGREQVWGIQMRRSVIRKNEWSHLTHVPLSAAGNGSQAIFRVSAYGTLVGIEAPPPSRNLEVKPYAISGIRTDLTADPTISNDGYADAGIDLKYGITENLTADVTFNTDFAQVEVDEQQVNLSRFDLSFPEKREFFLEGRGIFNFGAGGISGGGPGGGGGGGGGQGGGGGVPTLFYSRQVGLHDGEQVPILAGGRITGKVGSFDVGALSIQTDSEPTLGAESTNFTVLRLRRDIFARSSVGVLLENRSRSVIGNGSNQVYGVDASLAFFENLNFLSYYAKTSTEGLEGNDESFRARFSYDADEWGTSVGHLLVGDDFNPEIGFVQRRGFRQTSASARVSPRPESIDWIRQFQFSANIEYFENERAGHVESRDRQGRFEIDFENGDSFNANFTNNYENLVEEARISGALVPAGRYSFRDVQFGYNFGPQRRYSGNLSLRRGDYFSGEITSVSLNNGRIQLRPQLSMEPSLSFNWIDLPELQNSPGQFNQHVARLRLNYSFTPRMFVSGLVQYNSGGDSFSSNVRLRWEWAPGSELFLVYTEDRNTDVLDRWSDLTNRGLVIKINRLIRL